VINRPDHKKGVTGGSRRDVVFITFPGKTIPGQYPRQEAVPFRFPVNPVQRRRESGSSELSFGVMELQVKLYPGEELIVRWQEPV
jgi:hypothetical protein